MKVKVSTSTLKRHITWINVLSYFSVLLTNTVTHWQVFLSNSFSSHWSLLFLDTEQFSKIVQSCQTDQPASVILTCLHGGLPPRDFLCDCVSACFMHVRPGSGWVVCVCVCVIPQTHLTGREKGLQQRWQCMTKCPPVNLPEWSWLLQWGRADKTKHMWERDQRAIEEAGLDVSIFLTGGPGDFLLRLKDGKLGIDLVRTGQWKTGTIVPWFGFEGVLFL